ncbi:YneF family protein [Cohnella cholangitidis]|uniref:YneF family protein n=1 Tax=Cohnella cholangitidis TaxID=2598458 RepID=A0A7G5BWR6_9BACL|nr:YneF family protein [Cohnella cholangitidis]QMV41400.1 YneF family protein [Cohnella cholangitidis]
MWSYIIPILTLIVGLIVGFIVGVYYLRYQMTKMQNNPEMLQKMAKQMGYNMNSQQLAKAQQMMKNQNSGGGNAKSNPGASQNNRNNPKFRR